MSHRLSAVGALVKVQGSVPSINGRWFTTPAPGDTTSL